MYCVYLFKDKITNKTFYVGEGTLRRPVDQMNCMKNNSHRNYKVKSKVKEVGVGNIYYEIVCLNSSKRNVLRMEQKIKCGLENQGYDLCNLIDGYEVPTSIDNSGKNNPMYGVKMCGKDNHFFGKNHSDESKKKMSKSRSGKCCGKSNPSSKLSAEDVKQIRLEYVTNKTKYTELADKYGVGKSTIGYIVTRRIWRHI